MTNETLKHVLDDATPGTQPGHDAENGDQIDDGDLDQVSGGLVDSSACGGMTCCVFN